MSLFKIFSVCGLAVVFLITGCQKEKVMVEPGARKDREIIEDSSQVQDMEMDMSNVDF